MREGTGRRQVIGRKNLPKNDMKIWLVRQMSTGLDIEDATSRKSGRERGLSWGRGY